MKKRYKILIGLVIVVLILLIGAFIWMSSSYEPMKYAVEVMNSGTEHTTDEGWMVFEPDNKKEKTGFIFYPGGKVEPEAYAPLAANIAEAGSKVIIVPMPFNLAVFGIDRADRIIDKYKDIKNWYIGGHSLGGAMAARYTYNNPDKLSGLILLASYPANTDDLSDSGLDVLTVFGTEDPGYEKIKGSQKILPDDTTWVEIEGGNHAQFGYYGHQKGDNKADISRESQQEQIVEAVAGFLSR